MSSHGGKQSLIWLTPSLPRKEVEMSLLPSHVTITINERTQSARRKVHRCTLTLTSADTYGASGVHLPSGPGAWGFSQSFSHIVLLETLPTLASDNYLWSWSATAGGGSGALQGFRLTTASIVAQSLQELASAITVDVDTKWMVEAHGW